MAMELIRKVTTIAETQGVAQAAAELDRLARAQAGVAVASDTTAKSSLSAANAYDRLARAIDPVAREQARLERGQTVVNRALSEGAISSDQAARTLGILTERHLAASRLAAVSELPASALPHGDQRKLAVFMYRMRFE